MLVVCRVLQLSGAGHIGIAIGHEVGDIVLAQRCLGDVVRVGATQIGLDLGVNDRPGQLCRGIVLFLLFGAVDLGVLLARFCPVLGCNGREIHLKLSICSICVPQRANATLHVHQQGIHAGTVVAATGHRIERAAHVLGGFHQAVQRHVGLLVLANQSVDRLAAFGPIGHPLGDDCQLRLKRLEALLGVALLLLPCRLGDLAALLEDLDPVELAGQRPATVLVRWAHFGGQQDPLELRVARRLCHLRQADKHLPLQDAGFAGDAGFICQSVTRLGGEDLDAAFPCSAVLAKLRSFPDLPPADRVKLRPLNLASRARSLVDRANFNCRLPPGVFLQVLDAISVMSLVEPHAGLATLRQDVLDEPWRALLQSIALHDTLNSLRLDLLQHR